jgi:hypothetical protein
LPFFFHFFQKWVWLQTVIKPKSYKNHNEPLSPQMVPTTLLAHGLKALMTQP